LVLMGSLLTPTLRSTASGHCVEILLPQRIIGVRRVSVSSTLVAIFILKNHKKIKYWTLCSNICYGNQLRSNGLYLQKMDSTLCKNAKRALHKTCVRHHISSFYWYEL